MCVKLFEVGMFAYGHGPHAYGTVPRPQAPPHLPEALQEGVEAIKVTMTCTVPQNQHTITQHAARSTILSLWYSTSWPVQVQAGDLQYAVYQALPRDGFRRDTSASLSLNYMSDVF